MQVRKLTRDIPGIAAFRCSKDKFVTYLQTTSFQDQKARIGKTWVFQYENHVIGFITIAMADTNKKEHAKLEAFPHSNIPALLIGQLATHADFERSGVGQAMIQHAINEAKKYSKDIGCRIVMLNPESDVVDWYVRRGFVHIPHTDNSTDIMFVDLDWIEK